ncbi:MAG: NAD(P)-binding domain-containing protein [Desulfarculus sp.]|nr:NAD(P)-binding domain-containing protein [Desulfarculus sp.]
MTTMRITIVGPGAVGLLWATRLALAGAEVNILDHRPQRAALLAAEGLRLEDAQGETHLTLPASADPDLALAGNDLAMVCVKAYHTREVAGTLASHLPAGARALTLQNGAGNVETLVEALGAERVLGGITSEGATLLGPGGQPRGRPTISAGTWRRCSPGPASPARWPRGCKTSSGASWSSTWASTPSPPSWRCPTESFWRLRGQAR